MGLLYVKSLHIIFVVTWFAGLFYIVRLFIYKAEADENKNEAEAILKDAIIKIQQQTLSE
jgi:putative membrane protein